MVAISLALATSRPRAASIAFPLQARWMVELPAPPAFAPAFDDDYAYFALQAAAENATTDSDQLVALDIDDGSTVWSVECPITAAPAAGEGLVFVGGEGTVEARTRTAGRHVWRQTVDGRVTRLHWDTGWLLAATSAGPFTMLRGIDGEILWQRDFGADLQGPPAPAGDRVYLPLNDGRIQAVSLLTGDDIWTRTLAEPAVGILPVGDRVFAGALDNQFYSLHADDGDIDWKWRTGADLLGLPVLDERRVYFVALDHVLRGHDRGGGSMRWKRVLPMRPFTGPLRNGDTLIVAGISSELRAYRASDGSPAGEFVSKGEQGEELLLAAPPHVSTRNVIILATKGGRVRGLESTADAADRSTSTESPASPPDAIAAPAPADTPGPDAAGGAAGQPPGSSPAVP